MNPAEDLAIVTSVYNYGAYLDDWASSVLALDRPPAVVGLFQHGSTDDSAAEVETAAVRLREGGLRVRVEHHPTRLNFGAARNRAVALSAGCAWVMHFDADDMLMPHALGDIAGLAPKCDVVALGYERCGDLAAGPKQRRKLYRSSQGRGVLVNCTPASGVSPYRRTFWERSPYDETMTGGWDTALWIGFGHLGARILPTRRPAFWYRQHADSVFNTRRLRSWPTAVVGNALQSRRRRDAGVSILVPRATEDNAHRVRAWQWIRARYERLRPTWEIVDGLAPAHPWQKGVALTKALERCHGRVAIVADADCVADLESLDEAVALVASGQAPWVVPHDLVHRLDERATAAWLRTEPDAAVWTPNPDTLCRRPYRGFAAGGILVVGRPMLAATGGIPHQFAGWGAEDEALAVIFDTLLGPHVRLGSNLVHLWHPPQTDAKASAARHNRVEYARIRALAGNPEALWLYLADPRSFPKGPPATIPNAAAEVRRQAWQDRAAQYRAEMAETIGDPRAAASRLATREARMGRSAKQHPGPSANKMLTEPHATKELRFANAGAAHLAERAGLTDAELRRRVPPGAPVSVDVVRQAIQARRSMRPVPKRAPPAEGAPTP